MISEGNDPTPSLLCSQPASRYCALRASAAGERAAGHPPGHLLSRPRSSSPDVDIEGEVGAKWRLGLAPPGQNWEP